MTHIRDKTISDLIADFGTLKIVEVWKLAVTVVALLTGTFSVGYYIGGLKSELSSTLCNLTLEQRTKLLREVAHDANWDVTNKINKELQQ